MNISKSAEGVMDGKVEAVILRAGSVEKELDIMGRDR